MSDIEDDEFDVGHVAPAAIDYAAREKEDDEKYVAPANRSPDPC